MKKTIFIFVALLSVLGFNACSEDDDFTFVAKPSVEGVAFENTFLESYPLNAANGDNLAERFVWNKADFGAPTPVKYELQASTTESFEGIEEVASDLTVNNYGVTVKYLLTLAAQAGLDNDPDTEAPNTGSLYFRVRAYVGDAAAKTSEQFSSIIALPVVLTEASEDGGVELKPQMFLVGDVTAAGWDPNNTNTPLFRDGENDLVFNFTGRFAGSADTEGFKIIEVLGEWQPQWGLDAGLLSNSEILGADPSAFPVSADGYYSLSINQEDMSFTFEAYDASAAPAYGTIGLIGDATAGGWDADQDLTPTAFDPHIWVIEGIELTEGEIKFRAEDAWDISWGASTPLSGQGFNDGDPNIPVTAGTYNIWFNDLDGRYILIPQQQ
jgi:hypothetical protein